MSEVLFSVKKLRWACRRGMLELDVILNRFLEEGYEQMTQQQKLDFQRFLEEADQDLFNWLLHRSKPEDKDFQALIQLINGHD